MSISGLKLPTKSEAEAREDLARASRAGWRAFGTYVIQDIAGHNIIHTDRTDVRDQIVLMAHSWDAMKAALEECAADFISEPCVMEVAYAIAGKEFMRRMAIAREALKLAGRT